MKTLSRSDSEFLAFLRGLAIIAIVFGHVGGFWFFKPYSEFLQGVVLLFFFISGAVSYFSFKKSGTVSGYYRKRLLKLLVPYYLLCLLSLCVYLFVNGKLPEATRSMLLHWITITPLPALMPFPVGQIWFLHTLVIITLASPLLFFLFDRRPVLLGIVFTAALSIAGMQMGRNIAPHFFFGGHNLYKPVVCSMFYIAGFVYYGSSLARSRKKVLGAGIVSLLLSIAVAIGFEVNIDYAFHVFSPDLYYVSGSFFAITVLLLARNIVVSAVRKSGLTARMLLFMHRHTFSIFLLHSFAIFIAERVFDLDDPANSTFLYGTTKFSLVMALTLIGSPLFTRASAAATEWLTGFLPAPSPLIAPTAGPAVQRDGYVQDRGPNKGLHKEA